MGYLPGRGAQLFHTDATLQIMYVASDGNDANDGQSWGTAKATISACQTAAPTGPLRINIRGTLTAQSFTVDRDGLSVIGDSDQGATIPYNGSGAAISNSNPATTRFGLICQGFRINGQGASAGAVGIQVDNFYRACFRDIHSDFLAVNATALNIVGSSTKSTYFGRFDRVDLTSAGKCLVLGENCNGHEFYGGVYDGTGSAIYCQPGTSASGECKWFGTAFQTSNTDVGHIGGGAVFVNTFEFHSLRVETGVAGTLTFANGSAKTCGIYGGSFSGCSLSYLNTDGHTFVIPQQNLFQISGSNGGNFVGSLISDLGTTIQATFQGGGIIQQGTAPRNFDISANGAAAVTINGRANSGTSGLTVFDGAASPAVAAAVSGAGVFSGKKLGANATVTGSRSANAALASLLTALNAAGLIVDSSTA